MKKLWIASCIVLLAAAVPALAQSGANVEGPVVGKATRHDVSPKLSEMAKPLVKQNVAEHEIPMGSRPDRTDRPAVAQGPDPLAQTEERPFPEAAATPLPSVNFPGLSDDDNSAIVGFRIVPPDTQGDVGVDYYVQWINLIFAIYDKDGSECGSPGCIVSGGGPFAGNTIWSGFGGPCETNNDGDPITLYDHLAGRWLQSQFSINEGIQCMAISQTSDPRGPYDRWAIPVSPGQQNDYPKIGIMPDAYYMSFRDFPSSPDLSSAVAIDRAAMLAGDPNPTFVKFSLLCLSNDCPDGIQPPHLEGPAPPAGTPGVFSKAWDDDFDGPLTGVDGYRLWELDPDFVTPANSTFVELPIVPSSADFNNDMCGFFGRNCVPQSSSTQRLDSVDELQMYRAQYRYQGTHEMLLISTTVDATGSDVAGVRWAELRNSGSGWTLFQDGTYAPGDGENRWMSSIAMDGDGNIALGYSVSSSSTDPSVRYTTRMAGDPLGTMPGGEVELIAGTGAQTGANRWGDYSSMSVDPVDNCTFWYTQEYYENTNSFDFKTRVGAFTIAGCGGPQPVCGNNTIETGEVCDGTDLGGATCSDFGCSGGTLACAPDCQSFDTSGCTSCPVCDNDGVCELGEDCNTCPNDCPSGTSSGASCGNGICEAGNGETCVSCAADCAGQQSGKPSNRFCCGDGATGDGAVDCSDSRCTSGGFQCTNVPVTPGSFCCGDLVCDSGESCSNCALDCTIGAELCSGGIDEDCDGDVDCNDADCAGDPINCPTCLPKNAICTLNSECCSGDCKANGRCR